MGKRTRRGGMLQDFMGAVCAVLDIQTAGLMESSRICSDFQLLSQQFPCHRILSFVQRSGLDNR